MPLRHPSFRGLLIAWLAACLCMWMNDVAAAWLMTSLTRSPVMVALVQTAVTLPIFIAGLPSGALADLVDRRRLLIFTQVWAIIVAVALFATAMLGAMRPALLLALVFANGMVLAARWPVFSATIPDLVPSSELAAASALSGVANNGSRIAGPLLAALIIASVGAAYVFAANAALSLVAALLLARWSYTRPVSALPRERLRAAIRVGLAHVRESPPMQRLLVRVGCFFVTSIALMALLPLVAHDIGGEGAGTYTLLVAAMGVGAVFGATLMPLANQRLSHEQRFIGGTLLYAAGAALAALAPNLATGMLALFIAGVAYMMSANTLMVVGTLALPEWVRARGLSIYQMTMMGGSAAGAAGWGYLASATSVRASLMTSAVAAVVALVVARRALLDPGSVSGMTVKGGTAISTAAPAVDPHRGPVLVTVEYEIDPARTADFLALMNESRRAWLGNGLSAWQVLADIDHADRHIEYMFDESWAGYLRRNERISAACVSLRERKRELHVGASPPQVRRYVGHAAQAASPLFRVTRKSRA